MASWSVPLWFAVVAVVGMCGVHCAVLPLSLLLLGASCRGTVFDGSQMNGLNMRLACCKCASFRSCSLRDAVLAGTDLEVCVRMCHCVTMCSSAYLCIHVCVCVCLCVRMPHVRMECLLLVTAGM